MVWFSNGGSKTEPFEIGISKRSEFECIWNSSPDCNCFETGSKVEDDHLK